jgi:hypothetical protein
MIRFLKSLFHTTKAMETRPLSYRTKDGQADYGFSFEEQSDGTWRSYVVRQPSYQGRDESAHSTHRMSDRGRQYLDWGSPLRSLDQAKQVAALWADFTQNYIRTGARF